MLNVRTIKHLEHHLGCSDIGIQAFFNVIKTEVALALKFQKGKPRLCANTWGRYRESQLRVLRNLLVPCLGYSTYNHGSTKGRSIKTNGEVHLHSDFAFCLDIASFYPSISIGRVNRLFSYLGCSPQASYHLARFCTCNGYLAPGLNTSPIIADAIMRPLDEQLASACNALGVVYSRFVDDLVFSGSFDLQKSNLPRVVSRILNERGFQVKKSKLYFYDLSKGGTFAGVRIKQNRLLAPSDKIKFVLERLEDHRLAQKGQPPLKPLMRKSSLRGHIHHLCWLNPKQKAFLLSQFESVNWPATEFADR